MVKSQAAPSGASQRSKDAELRAEMYQLEQDIADHNDDVVDLGSDMLQDYIKRANEQNQRVSKAADQQLATGTFNRLVKAGSHKVMSFCRSSTAAAPADLARALLKKFGTGIYDSANEAPPLASFGWVKLGTSAALTFRSIAAASLDCMFGAVEPPKAKVQAKRERKKRQLDVGPAEHPDDMDTEKQDDQNETSKLTEAMYERIEAHSGRAYAHFVLDRRSFAQTVENMFSIAILIGNAKIALLPDASWGMRVELPHADSSHARARAEPAQMVLNMNFAQWMALKDAVQDTDCLTPHRAAMDFAYVDGSQPSKRVQLSL